VQTLRRWVPASVRDAADVAIRPTAVPLGEASAQDIAFCSKLHRHGGVAVAATGFSAEAELLRMRQAGLLELQRDKSPPFAVTRVALTAEARAMLTGGARTGQQPAVRNGSAKAAMTAAPTCDPDQQRMLRRNGFEVARGMCNAAVKSEIAAWKAAGGPGGPVALETRILTRISAIEVPFAV
jgi:hypothetical protein